MKRIIKGIIAITFLIFCMLPADIQASSTHNINTLDIQMEVGEDGSLRITESYEVYFREQSHGFYRVIPTNYDMEWTVDNEIDKQNYYFPVSDIECHGTTCEVERNNEGVSIRLGDADRYVKGTQNYTISYKVQTKDLAIKGNENLQMIYWNLVGNDHARINHLTYSIQMPKEFPQDGVYTASGTYGSTKTNLTTEFDGNTIFGESLDALSETSSATIVINLPENYFTFPEPADYGPIVAGICGVIGIIAIILFFKFGKDDDVIVTVEFSAPKDLNSAGVGYVIDNTVDTKDVTSLLIDWANRGYIDIIDKDHHITLKKKKELEKEKSTGYEHIFFNAVFTKDEISEEDLKTSKVSTGLRNTMTGISNYFSTKKNRVFEKASMALQIVLGFLIGLPTLLFTGAAIYSYYESLSFAFPALILAIIMIAFSFAWMLIMKKRHAMKRSSLMMLFILFIVIFTIILCIASLFMLNYKMSFIYIIIYLVTTILLIFIMLFMDKRTKRGNEWLGQILGLKDFIMNCEKDRLELLVEDNPSAFYDILPYAYVLGVSDVWAKKFEHIVMQAPSWYVGDYDHGNIFVSMLWWNHFHHTFRNISTAAAFQPEIKGGSGGGISGGGFGGGGFGGGFSGGGFGGGSSGSW